MVSPNYITQYLSDNWLNQYELSKLKYVENFYMRDSVYVPRTSQRWCEVSEYITSSPLPRYCQWCQHCHCTTVPNAAYNFLWYYPLRHLSTPPPRPPPPFCRASCTTIWSHFANSASRRSMSDTPDVETKQKPSSTGILGCQIGLYFLHSYENIICAHFVFQ